MQDLILVANLAQDIPDTVKSWLSIFPAGLAKWITAILLFLVGSFVAKLVGRLVVKALEKTDFDNKLAAKLGAEDLQIEKLLGTIVTGILMLYAIAIALQAAELDTVVDPLTNMMNQIMLFIPKLLAAAAIMFVGFLAAKIVRQLIESSMEAAKIDERLKSTGSQSITKATGGSVFALILLVALPAALEQLQIAAIADPVADISDKVLGAVPKILLAGVLLVIGYKLAAIVRDLITNLLNGTGVNALPAKIGLEVPETGAKSLAGVIGYIVMVSIIVVISATAITALELEILAGVAESFKTAYFNILLAVIILGAGILLGRFAHKSLADKNATLAKVAKIAIIVVTAMAAIERSKIVDPRFVEQPFQYFLMAVAGALLIGGGIALGLGGKDWVASKLKKES